MNLAQPSPKMTEEYLLELLELTVTNQRADGLILTEAERIVVETRLRDQFGLPRISGVAASGSETAVTPPPAVRRIKPN